ncbi:hypothetical protein LHK_02710 [Laribacter hongkongensis HLHK9]|uniref:Uncharacterized protein n=1 Tax=Laribacter hongkongensis (strain HLHK9) TaxID=557598 RepID=C1DCS3_LARHH|nr:hypothetical protein LHK_02710 [Laribacter hongkongensis HLHK9]
MRDLIQHPRDVLARHRKIDRNLHCLVAEVIGHRQAFKVPAANQMVADEIHAPNLIQLLSRFQRRLYANQLASAVTPPDG